MLTRCPYIALTPSPRPVDSPPQATSSARSDPTSGRRATQAALAAVDDLLAAQTVTIRALALVPALLLLALPTKGVRILFLALFSHSCQTHGRRYERGGGHPPGACSARSPGPRRQLQPLSDVALGALGCRDLRALSNLSAVCTARFKGAAPGASSTAPCADLFAPRPAGRRRGARRAPGATTPFSDSRTWPASRRR